MQKVLHVAPFWFIVCVVLVVAGWWLLCDSSCEALPADKLVATIGGCCCCCCCDVVACCLSYCEALRAGLAISSITGSTDDLNPLYVHFDEPPGKKARHEATPRWFVLCLSVVRCVVPGMVT